MQSKLSKTGNATAPTASHDVLQVSISVPGDTIRRHEAIAGLHLVEIMRAHAVPVKAECGGACVCATCHVRVPAAWQDRLPPASDEELAKLDQIPDADETSRLACQIVMSRDLDGLEVEIQPDSRAHVPPARTAA